MKHKLILSVMLVASSILLYASSPLKLHTYQWSNAGNQDVLANDRTVNIWNFDCDYRGEVDNSESLLTAINQLGAKGGVINFEAGVYLFNKSINIPSNVILKGDGVNTVLVFELDEELDAITFNGKLSPTKYNVLLNAKRGANVIYLNSVNGLAKGDLIKISLPESNLTTSDWAKGSIGQLVTIKEINNNQIVLNTGLRLSLNAAENILVQKVEPVRNAGLSCLQIIRTDETVRQTSNVVFNYAQNCFVKGVISDYCNFAHVEINNSYQVQVSGSYFRYGHSYGNGGKAYGTVLQFSSSDCLIQDNAFNRLRHAILLQAGSNGNVIAYNYSASTYWQETALPDNSAGDITLHGNYPFANLFEGNIVQNIVVDDSHGANGPHNTFFKNTAELYGLLINPNAADSQNIIGNRITKKDFLYGNYLVYGKGHYEQANYVKNKYIPTNSSEVAYFSLFLAQESTFILKQKVSGKKEGYRLKAEARHFEKVYTACESKVELSEEPAIENYIHTSAPTPMLDNNEIGIYPNPTSDFINIDYHGAVTSTLIDLEGKTVFSTVNKVINITTLPKGVYYLRIEENQTVLTYRKVLIQ